MQKDLAFSIDLLRHGEPVGGKRYRGITDDVLSSQGWRQMHSALETDEQWDHIITSPLLRCQAFSFQIGQQRQINVTENKAWQEMDFGLWEGATSEQLWQTSRQEFGQFLSDPTSIIPPDGESIHQLCDRVKLAWQSIVSGPRQKLLLVTHGGPIRIVLHLVLGIPLASTMKIAVPFASLTRLEVLFHEQAKPCIRLKSHGH